MRSPRPLSGRSLRALFLDLVFQRGRSLISAFQQSLCRAPSDHLQAWRRSSEMMPSGGTEETHSQGQPNDLACHQSCSDGAHRLREIDYSSLTSLASWPPKIRHSSSADGSCSGNTQGADTDP